MDELSVLKAAVAGSLIGNAVLVALLRKGRNLMIAMFNDLTSSCAACRRADERLIASQKEYIEWLNERIWELTPAEDRARRLAEIEVDYRQRGYDITTTALWKIHHGLPRNGHERTTDTTADSA